MKVDMGTVWDRTTEFLSDNFGAIVPVFVGALWLPQTLSSLAGTAATQSGGSAGFSLFGLILVLPGIWAGLAIAAHALQPDAGPAPARAMATRSFGWAVLIVVLIALVQFALALPAGIALVAGGLNLQALAANRMQAAFDSMSPAAGLFAALYLLAWLVVALVISVRTALATPALVAEQAGIGAIGRSIQLSRGIVWKMIGVYLLFFVLMAVASMAVQSAFGAIFSLLLPSPNGIGVGAIVTAILTGLVGAIGALVIAAFGAKLYIAATGTAGAPASASAGAAAAAAA